MNSGGHGNKVEITRIGNRNRKQNQSVKWKSEKKSGIFGSEAPGLQCEVRVEVRFWHALGSWFSGKKFVRDLSCWRTEFNKGFFKSLLIMMLNICGPISPLYRFIIFLK